MIIGNMACILIFDFFAVMIIARMKNIIKKTNKPIEVTTDHLNTILMYAALPFSVIVVIVSLLLLILG